MKYKVGDLVVYEENDTIEKYLSIDKIVKIVDDDYYIDEIYNINNDLKYNYKICSKAYEKLSKPLTDKEKLELL